MSDDLTSLVSALDMMERWKQRAEAAEAELDVQRKRAHTAESELTRRAGESGAWEGKARAAEAEVARLRNAGEFMMSFIKYSTGEFGSHDAELIETKDGLHWSVGAWGLRQALAQQEKDNGHS